MKTSQSFFPTRTHLQSRQNRKQHKDHLVQVVKPKQRAATSPKSDDEGFNMFRDIDNPAYKQETQNPNFRPVGGQTLFKKMVQFSKDHPHDKKISKRSNKQFTMRNIATTNIGSRFKRQKNEHDEGTMQEMLPLKSINQNQRQHPPTVMVNEFFKSHANYSSSFSSAKTRKNTITNKSTFKSQNITRPKTGKAANHKQWASTQSREYHDKSALLNEINYNKPLVERYGDHYFEYILRNRFEDDLKPPPYIYLLSGKKFSDTKAISKIKYHRPDIKERQMLVLKGRKLDAHEQNL